MHQKHSFKEWLSYLYGLQNTQVNHRSITIYGGYTTYHVRGPLHTEITRMLWSHDPSWFYHKIGFGRESIDQWIFNQSLTQTCGKHPKWWVSLEVNYCKILVYYMHVKKFTRVNTSIYISKGTMELRIFKWSS